MQLLAFVVFVQNVQVLIIVQRREVNHAHLSRHPRGRCGDMDVKSIEKAVTGAISNVLSQLAASNPGLVTSRREGAEEPREASVRKTLKSRPKVESSSDDDFINPPPRKR